MKNNWVKSGNDFFINEVSAQIEKLDVAVYIIKEDPRTEECYLSKSSDNFKFPYKIYGKDDAFVNRVFKTFHATSGNLGVLLNGIRGTGKTVTAKQICNKMNLPVIILPRNYKNVVPFLNSIQQDFVFFMDEYEKMFDKNDYKFLTIMDGVLKSKNRILFLMTTNELYVEQNLLQRPSRIRYIKKYGDLELSIIEEIVDDTLIHKELRAATIKMISNMSIITIDLVKAVVEEVNIHKEDPELFKDFFNADDQDSDITYNVYKLNEKGEREQYKLYTELSLDIDEVEKEDYANHVGHSFYIGSNHVGNIVEIIDNTSIQIQSYIRDIEASTKEGKPVNKALNTIYVVERTTRRHKNFQKYVF
jgi:hypothetical protein